MPDLPTGIVTFVLTDVEGSTHLWELYPEAIHAALRRHEKLAADCFAKYGGQIIKPRGEGDSLFAVFRRASDAAAGACSFQVEQAQANRAAELPLKVRIALHTGEAELREGDYYGTTVNRCARIRAIAHGGQTLLSESAQQLACESLPAQASLRDMGMHLLRDIARPEHIYQLLHPALPADFPPLKSLSNLPHNLPIQLTGFVGREAELAEIQELLKTHRLLTLTGVGGCGKTRLALQAVADRSDDFPDGIWFVDLAALTDSALVIQAVVKTLHLNEEPGRDLLDTLADALRDKRLLLLLDNCEHLLAGCVPLVSRLLRTCPRLRCLVTSQEALGILGEKHWPVPPLPLPVERGQPLSTLAENPSVRLFLERAAAVSPGLALTEQNAPQIAAICRMLDGLPLALELAAARTGVLKLEQIRLRLSQRFRLLSGGNRDGAPRHQTLRATMDWSYDLLARPEQALLRRLAVFSGGWTLEAAEAICGEAGTGDSKRIAQSGLELSPALPNDEVFDLLARLVERSLVVCEESEDGATARYRLLETVRQYGLERLEESGEHEAMCRRHQTYFTQWAEQMEAVLMGEAQAEALYRVEAETANLREAIILNEDANAAAHGLRLANALYLYWETRGYFTEGRALLMEAVERAAGAQDAPALVRAMTGIGALAWMQGDYSCAQSQFEASLELRRQSGDSQGVADLLNNLGNLALSQGDYAKARPLFEESLHLLRSNADKRGIAVTLGNLALLDCEEGDYPQARARFEEGLALERERKNPEGIANLLDGLGEVAFRQEEYAAARERKAEALRIRVELEDRHDIAESLEGLAAIGAKQECWEAAACLLGAAEALRESLGAPLTPRLRDAYAELVQSCRETLSADVFEAARNRGRALSWEQATAFALENCSPA